MHKEINSMGDVVSIRKSTDDDLHALFVKACPVVPDAVSEKVRLAAGHSLGGRTSGANPLSFKTVCVIVIGACLLGAGLVKGFTTRWNQAVDSANSYTVQAEILHQEARLGAALPANTQAELQGEQSWHRTKAAWAEYIARLERDPFYQYVQQEKKRFKARYQTGSLE